MSSQDGGFSDAAADVGSAAGPAQVPAAASSAGPASSGPASQKPRVVVSGTIPDALATDIADKIITNISENAGDLAIKNVDLWFRLPIHKMTPLAVKIEFVSKFHFLMAKFAYSAKNKRDRPEYDDKKAIGEFLSGMRALAESVFETGKQMGKTEKFSEKKKSGAYRASNWAQTIRSITNDAIIYGFNVYDAILNNTVHQGLTRQIRMFDKTTPQTTPEPSRQELINALKNKLKTKKDCFVLLHKCGLMPQAQLSIADLRELCRETFIFFRLRAEFDSHLV